MKITKFMPVLAAVLMLGACVQKPPAPPPMDVAAEDALLRANIDVFVAAWNVGDVESYAAMIADDVIDLPQGQAMVSGKDAVLEVMKVAYDPAVMQQSHTVEEVVFTGDHALAWGTWQLTPTDAAPAGTAVVTGKWMGFYKRTDAGWLLWRWIWNETEGDAAPVA